MVKLSELKPTPPHICIYGEVGSGKTALALTCGARAQIIDLDNGLRTGIALHDQFREDRLQVDVKQFLELDPVNKITVFSRVKAYIYGLSRDMKAGNWPFEVLIIDSLSTFADSSVATIMHNSGRIGKNPEIQHWGMAITEIKNVLNVVKTFPCVVILIAHEQVKTIGTPPHEENKLELALFGKKLPSQIARYYDELWYLRNKPAGRGKISRTLQTVSNGIVAARSRDCLPDLTDADIGMWALLKKIGYEPKKETTSVKA